MSLITTRYSGGYDAARNDASTGARGVASSGPFDAGAGVTVSGLNSAHSASFIAVQWMPIVLVTVSIWILMRFAFYQGMTGSDDMYYMRFAAAWDRVPVNHWEARLLGNALTGLSLRLFGRSVLSAVLPSLLASFVMLFCVLYASHRFGTPRSAWFSGLLVAVLPVDVLQGTTISPFTIMSAFFAVGTIAFLLSPMTVVARYVAATTFALGVITHFAGAYYVACLLGAGLLIDRPRFKPAVLATFLATSVLIVVDLAVLHFLFGDAWARLRVCLADTTAPQDIMPVLDNGRVNAWFLAWPILHLGYSKAFGPALLIVLVVGGLRFRRLSPCLRVMWLASVMLWVWMSFGSQVPWSYRPFARLMRFLQPLVLLVAVLFGVTMTDIRSRRYASAAAAIVVATCVVNLLASGPWGQNVRVSQELLAYSRDRPEQRFVTDYHTLNEMFVLNSLSLPPNVVTTADVRPSQLLDRNAPRLSSSEIAAVDGILENPLNVARSPSFTQIVATYAGTVVHETETTHRALCRVVPSMQAYPWSIRKPPARVRTIGPNSTSDLTIPGGDEP